MTANLIDASTLTPQQRREVMPSTAKELESGFLYHLKKSCGIVEISVVENGHKFVWRKPK